MAIPAQPLDKSLNVVVDPAGRMPAQPPATAEQQKHWLKLLTTSATYPLISHNPCMPLGSSALFRKRLLDRDSELYFGLTTRSLVEALVWPSIWVNGERLPIMILNRGSQTFSEDLVVFAFVTHHVCHTVPLGGPSTLLADGACHLAGISDSATNNRNALRASRTNASPSGQQVIEKKYHCGFGLQEKHDFSSLAVTTEWQAATQFHARAGKELLLSSLPTDKSMVGGPVISPDGLLVGIVKCGLTGDRAIAIDVRAIAGEIVGAVAGEFGAM